MIIVDIVLRSSIVMLAAILGSMALGHRSAALRHRVTAAGLFAAVFVVPLSLALPNWNVTVPSADAIEYARANLLAQRTAVAPIDRAAGLPTATVAGAGQSAARQPGSVERLAGRVWAMGTIVSLTLIVLAFKRLVRLTRTASTIADRRWNELCRSLAARHRVNGDVVLLRTGEPDALATWGWRRPCILFPSHAESWSEARLHVVLSHELAHVRRADWLVQIAAEVIRAVFWFNPLFWIACSRLRRDSECACDVAVLVEGTPPHEYASELLEIARTCRSSRPRLNVAMSMARPSTLEWRITAMLNTTLARATGSPRARAMAVAALVAITIPIATFTAQEQAEPRPLTGSVYDVSRAVLPQVSIALEDTTGTRRETTTDSSGRFEFDSVAAGDYTISATLPGFRSLRQQVTLRSARNWERAITLQVGMIEERITVQDSAPDGAMPQPSSGALRVGGNIKPPRKTHDVKPVYSQEMRDAGYDGVVQMEAVIGVDGAVTSLRVHSSQVHPQLADAAVDAVRQWRFTPTLLNGVAVEVSMTVTVQFRLPD